MFNFRLCRMNAHIVISGILYCSDAEHQSQWHNSGEPGEGGDLRYQLTKTGKDLVILISINGN